VEELLRVQFPGSEIILGPSGGWDGLELEFPKWKGSREDCAVSRRVICYVKLKWSVFSLQPYKSPGIDGIMPIMLQQSFELLTGKRLGLLRFSLALGYVVMSWKHIRVVFITKPGKHMSQAKSLSPVSLTSFVLKIFEKLLDRHIRGVFWYQNHFILTNLPIGQVRLQKQLSSWWFLDWKIFEVYGDCLGYLPGF